MKQDFISIQSFSKEDVYSTWTLTKDLKNKLKKGQQYQPLEGKTLAMIFQKPSNRTRVSFQVGMYQLGGQAIYLGPDDIGIGTRESVADIARVLSRFCDAIMARVFEHEIIQEFATYAEIPVINGLSDLLHPCQIMGDMMTIMEHKENVDGITIAFVGDGNNVANSWLNLSQYVPMTLNLGVPKGYEPNPEIVLNAKNAKISTINLIHDPFKAVKDADVIYTDVWASMGQEKEAEERNRIFRSFQVNQDLLNHAQKDAIVLHCLPAHRGYEITDQVMDGPQSVVFDQAENRLHVQKAILLKLLTPE